MKITTAQNRGWLEMRVEGRLDAAWAEHFLEAARDALRAGHHRIRLDALALEYISSAGLRSLLRAHRELAAVNGVFNVARASEFVIQTLRMSGFDSLLALEEPEPGETAPAADATQRAWAGGGASLEIHDLEAGAALRGERLGRWRPWQPVEADACPEAGFGDDHLALGIGAPGRDFADVRDRLGEFVAAAGCVAYLPGDGTDAPDYLVGADRFVPRLVVADALRAEGRFSHLLRFHPGQNGAALPLATLMEGVLAVTGAATAGFALLAEIDGLVGVALARSPGLIDPAATPGAFPQIRDWLSFSGERVHAGAQALVVGFVSSSSGAPPAGALPPLPSRPGWRAHAHAAVFPFHPLPNGRIELGPTVRQVFGGAEPVAILHLLEDFRPALGLGQSSFVRGACWCAPVAFSPEGQT
jgi:anti-anti-sigma factor